MKSNTTIKIDGVIVADKPAGVTSHDVVAMVKRTLGAKKVGHLGTLDPNATGVLPLVVNGATRLATSLGAGTKVYRATLKLGVSTDSYDAAGEVVAKRDLAGITEQAVREVLAGFVGTSKQTPPMFSAIKKGGVPLYKLARAGKTVEREQRPVTIYSLEVVRVELPEVEFIVEVSGGTYVRSICNDAGERLGCGGHLAGLVRTRSGAFAIESAVDPRSAADALIKGLIPISEALKMAGSARGEIHEGKSGDDRRKSEYRR